jgi:conjugative relaxase-like TrwC/TraI family protein
MLRVTQSNSAGRAKSYYSTADYYTEGQELVGLWRGKGAERLGLSGRVDRADWDALCDNQRPHGGETLTVRQKNERRVGYDFNFHCPKSVSLLYGISHDDRILQAFQESVAATMEDIESEAKARVRAGGKDEDRITGNLVWGEFVHLTARPEDGVPDPHLHAHCFVFNATFDGVEDRWKAGQFGDLKRDAPFFEAMFHSRMARRLEELGLETQRTATGWELKGLTPELLEKFSRRTAHIEKLAKERGITDPELKADLGAQTRSSKSKELTMTELDGLWRSRMTPGEAVALEQLAKRVGRERIGEDERAGLDAVTRAVSHVFERSSVVPERTLLAEALKQGVGRASAGTITRQLGEQGLIHAVHKGRSVVTTEEVLREEAGLIAFARDGRGACRPIANDTWRIQNDDLEIEQREAVQHILQSRDRVMVVRGAAGTGKTWTMQELRAATEHFGVHLHAFAPSADASRGVLRGDGFADAETVARLLADEKLQAEVHGGIIWIDEAGLVGTKTLRQVFDLAGREHARVLLSGDRRQHGSVERGAALRLLEEEAGLKSAELKKIQRQKGKYKAAVRDLSEGRIKDGFERLDDLGWIRELPDEERYDAIAGAYVNSLHDRKSVLVVSPTHAEGDRITEGIRQRLQKENLLGSESRDVSQLTPRNLTLGQRRDPASYEPGDVLVFHQNARGYRKGQRVVVGRAPVPVNQAARFTVYRQSHLGLAQGDRIRITLNGSTADGGYRLNNGDLFTVKGFAPDGDLRVEKVDPRSRNGPKEERLIAQDYGHLSRGFVLTSHASQGKTFDRVIVGQSSQSFPASSREQFYVSASRGRHQVLVFTDNKEELLDVVAKGDERTAAMDLVRSKAQKQRQLIRHQIQEPAKNSEHGAARKPGREDHTHVRQPH